MTNPYDPSGGYGGGQQQPGYGAPGGYQAPPPQQYGGGYGQPPGYGGMAGGMGQPAGWGSRFLAGLIDWAIFAVPAFLLSCLIGFGAASTSDPSSASSAGLLGQLIGGALMIGWIIYLIVMQGGASGQTLGAKAVGVRVVNEQGQPAGMGASAIRNLVLLGPTIVPCLGFIYWIICGISPNFDKSGRSQGWHDKAAKTLVVTTK